MSLAHSHEDAPHAAAADLVIAELLTTAGLADPYTRFERLRAMGRAVPTPLGLVLTGYDDCQSALRNQSLRSDAAASFEPLLGASWNDNQALKLLAESLLFLEGSAHNRVRKLVVGAFTPTAVAGWQPTIDAIAEQLLADVAQRLHAGEEVDLVESLARPLPIAVMAELLGLPHTDAAHLQSMIAMIADLNVGLVVGDDALQQAHRIGGDLDGYLRSVLTGSKAVAGIMGRIALDTSDGISDDDRVSLAFILLAAGFETTAMLVANAVSLLLDNVEEWTKLSDDPGYAELVIEETLRLQAPAAFTTRFAIDATTVGGTEVAAGESLVMVLAAANRDPEKFTNASQFQPSRYQDKTATPPLSFGSGIHHCLGSTLARSEGMAVMNRLYMLGAPTNLRLVRPITWRPSLALRGVESLVIARHQPTADVINRDQTSTSANSMETNARRRRRATNSLVRGLVTGFVGAKVRAKLVRGERRAEIKEAFAAESAAKAVEVMGDLKGVTMKMGQMASFLGATMPDVAKRSLAALQSNAPAMTPGLAEATVEKAFGQSLSKLFAEWSHTPVAAASIGQVHRARLHDGREVAVKVQYPGVGDAMAADLKDQARMTKLFSRFAMRSLDADTLSKELSERINQELDFVNEANHQREFAARYSGHPFIRVPSVIAERSNRTVLTSTWADGENWSTFLGHATQHHKDRAGEIIARFVFGSTRRYRHFNADPNPGNFLFHPTAEFITFLDFGLSKKVDAVDDKRLWLLVDSLMDDTPGADISRASIDGGYLREDHDLDPELLARFLKATSDFFDVSPFTVTTEWLAKVMKTTFLFEGEYSVIRNKLSTQADFFLRDRTYWGMLGVLAELEATASWRPINNEYRNDSPPSSPLGSAEYAWYQAKANRTS